MQDFFHEQHLSLELTFSHLQNGWLDFWCFFRGDTAFFGLLLLDSTYDSSQVLANCKRCYLHAFMEPKKKFSKAGPWICPTVEISHGWFETPFPKEKTTSTNKNNRIFRVSVFQELKHIGGFHHTSEQITVQVAFSVVGFSGDTLPKSMGHCSPSGRF